MNTLGNIAAISVLTCLAVQDFRSRSISAWLLPAVVVCMLLPPASTTEFNLLLYPNFAWNATLLVVQFTFLWMFISWRNRRWTNIINTQIGTGDIVVLFCLAPFFSPLNYFVLFTFAIVFSLIAIILCRALNRLRSEYIPFAGLYAIPLILLCTARLFFPEHISFSSDEWLNTFLTPPVN